MACEFVRSRCTGVGSRGVLIARLFRGGSLCLRPKGEDLASCSWTLRSDCHWLWRRCSGVWVRRRQQGRRKRRRARGNRNGRRGKKKKKRDREKKPGGAGVSAPPEPRTNQRSTQPKQ